MITFLPTSHRPVPAPRGFNEEIVGKLAGNLRENTLHQLAFDLMRLLASQLKLSQPKFH